MTAGDVGVALATACAVAAAALIITTLITAGLLAIPHAAHAARARVRCWSGRHGWITVTFTYYDPIFPYTRYRTCSTCGRREELTPEGP